MGITFNSTATTLSSSFYLNANLWATMKAAEKLSSGLRINSAADDPAGLVISENLRSSIASLNSEIYNLTANIGKYQTTSSTVQILRSSLSELKALAVGAANEGGNSEGAQAAYAQAADSLVNTFNSIVSGAEYNGTKTLDGSDGSLASIDQLQGIDLSTTAGAEAALEAIDLAAENLDDALVDLGATQRYDLEARVDGLRVTRQNLIAAESQLRDVNFLEEFSNLIGSQIRSQAAIAMMAHSNIMGFTVLKLFGS